MKVFIKILGLIGLINCIVLYGAEGKKPSGLSIGTQLDQLESGRRPSQENLMPAAFSDQYADRHQQPQSRLFSLISRFQDEENAAFAKDFLRSCQEQQRATIDAALAGSLKHRGRLSTSDGIEDQEPVSPRSSDQQARFFEALIAVMQDKNKAERENTESEERLRIAEGKQAQEQFQASGAQADRLAQSTSRNTRFGMALTFGLGVANFVMNYLNYAK